MLQATEEIREQSPEQIREQQSVVKAQAPQPEANDAITLAVSNASPSVALKVLSREEFLLSSYSHSQKQGQESIPEAPYYLVIATENGEQDISGTRNSCIPLIADATKPESFDWNALSKAFSVNEPDIQPAQSVKFLPGKDAECSKKTSMVVATSKGALCFNLSPKGNIELLSAPPELALAVSTPGTVSHKSDYKSAALTVTAKSFVNKGGTLSVDNLNLNCTSAIVNAGDICTKNLQVSGNSQLCNRKHAKIVVEQRCLIQQTGELKNFGLITTGIEGCVLETGALHNAGKVSSLGSIALTVAAELHNHANASINAHEKLIIHQAPEVLNYEKLVGKQGVQLEGHPAPNQRFVNGKHGSVLSEKVISLSLGTMTNKGNIKGAAVQLRGSQDFENHGYIDAQKQSLVIQVPGVFQHQAGTLTAKQEVIASAEDIQNAALIEGKDVTLTAAKSIENQSSAAVIAKDKLVASAPSVLNANQMKAEGDASITTERFENKPDAEVVARNGLFSLNAAQTVNRGKIIARNATFKRMPGDAEALTLDNTDGVIDIQKRLILQQGRIKDTRGKCFAETLRGNTTGALNNQHGRIQVRKRARLNIRSLLQNSHGAIVQQLRQTDNVVPDSTGIWIKTRENIRCTDGSEISAVQGAVDISPAIPGSRVENTQKIMVDDSSRIGGATATKISGFNQVRFSTPATGKTIDINSDRIQLERGVLSESAVPMTETEGEFRSQNLWKMGSAAITQTQGKFRFEDIWKAGKTTLNLLEGETITQPYTALGSLSYRLAPTATQPLVFLANQTSLQGDFTVEAPVPVKLGDATHFVTIKTEYGNFSVKAPIFDIEQGGVVSANSFIDAPGGFMLGRLVEDPNRKVFGKVNVPGINVDIRFCHLFKLPVAMTNGSFLHSKVSVQIIGFSHLCGTVKTHHLTIDSHEPSLWEASMVQVTGDCTLTGSFILKRTGITFSASFEDPWIDEYFRVQFKHLLCNSDPTSLTVQGKLAGSAVIDVEGSCLYAKEATPTVSVNPKDFVASCFQEIVTGVLEQQRVLNNHQIRSHSGRRGCWMQTDWRLPGFSAPESFVVRRNGFTSTPTIFPAKVSVNSPVILNPWKIEGHFSAPAMLIVVGKDQVALGSPNPYYIEPKAPVRDLTKGALNVRITHVDQDLKTTLEQAETDKFHFMVRELFWFNDAHAQAFYRDISEHLFVVSPEGIKRADPRAVLSLSPKLLVERVQAETQSVLMRGYITAGELIDEHLVQRLHHNATAYLTGVDYQTIKDFLSGKSGLKTAPTNPLIYYEPIMNEQEVEILEPRLYIPPALINEVRAQRGGLFKTNLLLVFSENVTPKQLTALTQHNPAMQSQVKEFFDTHSDEQKFLADHAAAALALENKSDSEQRAILESKHDAEHLVSVPKHALALCDKQKHQASVTFSGNYDVGTMAVLAEGTVSLVAANIKAEHVLLASLFDDVCLKAIVERYGNNENFYDVLRRTNIEAEGILQILSGKDVIFEAAHTQSGLGTHIEALGNILDMPVQLVRQQVQHFHERKRQGTVTDVHITQVPCIHETNANYTALAGASVIAYGTKYKAENVALSAVENVNVLPVTNGHQQTCDTIEKSRRGFGGSRTKTTQSISMQETAIPAQFEVKKNVTITSGKEVHCFMDSSALENHFWAEVVHIMQGVNQSCSVRQTSSRGIFWQKFCSEMVRQVTYTESNFSGSIEIHAKQTILEQVRGKTLGFWGQVECNDTGVTYHILDPQYVHDSKRIQGPSQGLVIVVSLAAGVATFGMGEVVAGSAFMTGMVGTGATMGTVVATGFSALCGQAAVSLLQNEGNPLKAVESLASVDTAKSVAMAMISAGVMKEICDALKLPGLGEKKSLLEHLQYNVARASVNVALNMSINHQSPGDALKAGFTDAAVGTAAGAVAQKIGGLRQEGRIGYASHKMLHAALGAVGGAILAGPKGAVAGAIGAVVAEIGAEACAPEEQKINSEAEQTRYKEERSRAANIGKLAGATTTLLMHQDVGTAVATATYAVENNFLTSSRRPASLLADFDEDVDVLELNDAPNDEMNGPEFMRYLARERTAESLTFKLDSRRDSRMPRNAWERLADDNTSVVPLWSVEQSDNHSPVRMRVEGGFQILEGVGQVGVCAPIGLATWETIVIPAVAFGCVAMGADNIATGVHKVWTGQPKSTLLYGALNAVGQTTGWYGAKGAAYLDMGLNFVGPGVAVSLTKGLSVSARLGPITQRRMFPEVESVERSLIQARLNMASEVNPPKALTFAYRSTAARPRPTMDREMFPEVGLVGQSLEKSNQSMLKMWDGYKNNLLPNPMADGANFNNLGPINPTILNQRYIKNGYFPPYNINSSARNILLISDRFFVRAHGDFNQISQWVMRAKEIEHLTPLQIKEKFGLEFIPKYISQVDVPKNTLMRVSVASPQPQWGVNGGGLQYQLLERIPKSSYKHQAPIYQPMLEPRYVEPYPGWNMIMRRR